MPGSCDWSSAARNGRGPSGYQFTPVRALQTLPGGSAWRSPTHANTKGLAPCGYVGFCQQSAIVARMQPAHVNGIEGAPCGATEATVQDDEVLQQLRHRDLISALGRRPGTLAEVRTYRPSTPQDLYPLSQSRAWNGISIHAGPEPVPLSKTLKVTEDSRKWASYYSSYCVQDEPIGLLGTGGCRQLRVRTEALYERIVIERSDVRTTYNWD